MTGLYLAIDTSTRYGAVGLWSAGALVRAHSWYSRHNHTSELMPAVEAALAASGATMADLTGIAVAQGPGGFSALRSGLGAAKGLAFAANLPVVGVSTVEASAYPHRGAGLPVCALIESGRGIVGWARFQLSGDGQGATWARRTPDRVTSLDAMLTARGRHTLFCGEGVATHTDAIREALGDKAHLAIEPAPLSRIAGVAELGALRLDAGDADPVASLAPRYLRSPAITAPNPPKAITQASHAGRSRAGRTQA
jgi:tRNA threonylcarbamoyladenosine biosynthesis protein TsaB